MADEKAKRRKNFRDDSLHHAREGFDVLDRLGDQHGTERTRITSPGIEAFNVSSAVNLVVAQRLVRRICGGCKAPHTYTDEELAPLKASPNWEEGTVTMKGTGCDKCNGTGYKGRAGIYEVMALSPELRRLILRGGSVAELRDQAVQDGMLTLRMDGIVKVQKGVTTLEEVVKETAG
jgi:type IV pilus assembly protein PilB